MAYLLVYNLNGRSAAKGKISRYLRRNAQMVQRSVWRFQDYRKMWAAAELVLAAGGRALAFFESDRIPFDLREVGRFLHPS